jgi:hypothetical protein
MSGIAEKVCIAIDQSHPPATAHTGGYAPATVANVTTPGRTYRPFESESRTGVVLNRAGGAL